MAAEAPATSGVEEVHSLWISERMSCDGDTVSITAAGQPAIDDVLLGRSWGASRPPSRARTKTCRPS